MASPKKTSLNLTTALVNALDVKEQLQRLTLGGDGTTVDARGIADRYHLNQMTKQKQTVEFMYHWFNSSTGQEATNLDISLWSIGGSAFLAELKSGNFSVENPPIETSGIAELYEYAQTTSTNVVVTTNKLIISSASLTTAFLTGSVPSMSVTVNITFAGESISIPGLLKAAKVTINRGDATMEDVTIELQGTPTTPGDTSSLIYTALIGSALVPFNFNTGVGTFSAVTAAITKLDIRFADKALIEQNLTLELQGGMSAA
jgi:hypothetical protein